MNKMTIALASAASLAIAACAQEAAEPTVTDDTAMADQEANDTATTGTIVDVASGNGDFSTLVEAVTAADLGSTLSGPGPYTVFAPTNAAFDKLPDGTLAELTTPEGRNQLTSILNYHVVEGNVDAASLMRSIEEAGEDGYTIPTVGGGDLTARVVDGNVVLTDAAGGTSTVTQTDVQASNGTIHAIDTVLMPQ